MKLHKLLCLSALCFLFVPIHAQVSIRDTIIEWNHFAYELNEDKSISDYSSSELETAFFKGIVIENKLIRLCLIPEFGGRIISYIYKPTGHEQFYQNPNGIPYAIGEGTFYYRWLMVYGGVFATFPEPEHGKTWLQAWNSQIIKNTEDTVSVLMEIKDTIDYSSHDGRFNNGVTGLECNVVISVYKGRSNFDMEISLENPEDKSVNYEYWTCTTLAPGSEPGNTGCGDGTEMILPLEYVKLKDDWWSWMGNSETPYQKSDHIFYFDNLSLYENWENMGIAYAYPDMTSNFWGVINHQEEEGILRIADNENITPGMKIWTWGYEQGLNADPFDFSNGGVGPYIELWAGHSNEFFEDANLYANEKKQWKESYMTSKGLSEITQAGENGAAFLKFSGPNDQNEYEFSASFFSTMPETESYLELSLEGQQEYILAGEYFTNDALTPFNKLIYKETDEIETGSYNYRMLLSDTNGNILLSAQKTIEITSPGFIPGISSEGKDLNISNELNQMLIQMETDDQYRVKVFNTIGQLIYDQQFWGNEHRLMLNEQGIYIVIVTNGDQYWYGKYYSNQ